MAAEMPGIPSETASARRSSSADVAADGCGRERAYLELQAATTSTHASTTATIDFMRMMGLEIDRRPCPRRERRILASTGVRFDVAVAGGTQGIDCAIAANPRPLAVGEFRADVRGEWTSVTLCLCGSD
jgi:hypothetical protein